MSTVPVQVLYCTVFVIKCSMISDCKFIDMYFSYRYSIKFHIHTNPPPHQPPITLSNVPVPHRQPYTCIQPQNISMYPQTQHVTYNYIVPAPVTHPPLYPHQTTHPPIHPVYYTQHQITPPPVYHPHTGPNGQTPRQVVYHF